MLKFTHYDRWARNAEGWSGSIAEEVAVESSAAAATSHWHARHGMVGGLCWPTSCSVTTCEPWRRYSGSQQEGLGSTCGTSSTVHLEDTQPHETEDRARRSIRIHGITSTSWSTSWTYRSLGKLERFLVLFQTNHGWSSGCHNGGCFQSWSTGRAGGDPSSTTSQGESSCSGLCIGFRGLKWTFQSFGCSIPNMKIGFSMRQQHRCCIIFQLVFGDVAILSKSEATRRIWALVVIYPADMFLLLYNF